MRTNKELLELLLEKVIEREEEFHYPIGLSDTTQRLSEKIDSNETKKLLGLIKYGEPSKRKYDSKRYKIFLETGLYWEREDIESRISWIKKNIKEWNIRSDNKILWLWLENIYREERPENQEIYYELELLGLRVAATFEQGLDLTINEIKRLEEIILFEKQKEDENFSFDNEGKGKAFPIDDHLDNLIELIKDLINNTNNIGDKNLKRYSAHTFKAHELANNFNGKNTKIIVNSQIKHFKRISRLFESYDILFEHRVFPFEDHNYLNLHFGNLTDLKDLFTIVELLSSFGLRSIFCSNNTNNEISISSDIVYNYEKDAPLGLCPSRFLWLNSKSTTEEFFNDFNRSIYSINKTPVDYDADSYVSNDDNFNPETDNDFNYPEDNPHYNDALDMDQQSQEFWDSI